MQKGAAVVLLQEVLIRKGTTIKVRRELRKMFPMYECYIAAGSHVDVGNDENVRTLVEEYARDKAQITVVTFLHKRVFQTNALARTWCKPRDLSALEHMAQGRVLWLEAKTHDNVSISIVNVHQATAKRHDLQQQVTLLLRAMIDAALTQRRRREVTSTRHSLAMAMLSLQVRYMTRWTRFSRTSCIQRMEH